MKKTKIFEDLFQEKITTIDEYKIDAILVISNKTDLMKTDILSKIRAIEGITRVHIESVLPRQFYEISKITVKINVFPFGIAPLVLIFNKIKKEIISIDGVQRLTYISKPEKI